MRISSKRPALSLALVALLLLPSVGLAQGTAAPTRDWSGLKAITSGSKLVTKLKTGKTVEGKLTGVSDTTLSLTVKGNPLTLNRDDIQSVHEVRGKSATKATLIGLGVGAGGGAAIGAAAGNNDAFVRQSAVAGVFGVIGAAVGALTGFAIGKSGHKRVLIYEAN